MKPVFVSALAAALALLAAQPAAAHSVWLQPDKDGRLVIENGDAGEPSDPYDPARITQAWAVDRDGKTVAVAIDRAATAAALRPDAKAAVTAALFDNKYWAKGQDGKWNNGPKGTVANPTIAGPSFKFPKAHLAPSAAFAKPLGLALEIVPLADPATLKAGDRLTVQVLLQGRPLADASLVEDLYLHHDMKPKKLKTDAEGKVTITVPQRSRAGVEVTYFDKQPGSSVEGTFYNASLVFPVKP
jgi:nickel transport protein